MRERAARGRADVRDLHFQLHDQRRRCGRPPIWRVSAEEVEKRVFRDAGNRATMGNLRVGRRPRIHALEQGRITRGRSPDKHHRATRTHGGGLEHRLAGSSGKKPPLVAVLMGGPFLGAGEVSLRTRPRLRAGAEGEGYEVGRVDCGPRSCPHGCRGLEPVCLFQRACMARWGRGWLRSRACWNAGVSPTPIPGVLGLGSGDGQTRHQGASTAPTTCRSSESVIRTRAGAVDGPSLKSPRPYVGQSQQRRVLGRGSILVRGGRERHLRKLSDDDCPSTT